MLVRMDIAPKCPKCGEDMDEYREKCFSSVTYHRCPVCGYTVTDVKPSIDIYADGVGVILSNNEIDLCIESLDSLGNQLRQLDLTDDPRYLSSLHLIRKLKKCKVDFEEENGE